MTMPNGVSWEVVLNEELQDINVAVGMLMDAAESPNDPPGYMAKMMAQVLAIQPQYTPVIVSKYADLLSKPELDQLCTKFAVVKKFIEEYAPAFKVMANYTVQK